MLPTSKKGWHFVRDRLINSNVHHNPDNVRIHSDPLPHPLNPNSQNIEIKMVHGGKCRMDVNS